MCALEVVRASPADADNLCRALLVGNRKAFERLPGAETGGVDRVITDMESRFADEYPKRLSDGSTVFFVARVDDNFAGYLEAVPLPNGDYRLRAWHVLPEYHGRKVGSRLMRHFLEFAGEVDVYSHTTIGSESEDKYRYYGFEEDLSVPPDHDSRETPPPMARAGLIAPQIPLVCRRRCSSAWP
ncbi:GNAT family N-acetyltransferase [Nocardia sp. NPDC051463]|uniref:GNAT family N-acetyltransferase n=1 Tax=Nocardia sp. NPDC051463 TaxID=3154845 RepID=UPI0034157EA2